LGGLLQGVYAFFGIAKFWRRHRLTAAGPDAALASFEYVYARDQTAEAVRIVLSAPGLTDAGRSLVEGLRAHLTTWYADPVDAAITRLATLTADSHRIGWRLRHLQPEAGDAAALGKAWLSGDRPKAASAALCQHPDLRWRQRIPAITRRIARGDLPAGAAGLAAAENALVEGHLDTARTAFLAAIDSTSGPDEEVRAWTGLALTVDAIGHTSAAQALRLRPDLVRAVYAELRAIGVPSPPIEIASWLAPAVAE
jgi:hypothetical protein